MNPPSPSPWSAPGPATPACSPSAPSSAWRRPTWCCTTGSCPTVCWITRPDGAELVCVDELPGCHPERVPGVHLKMIEAARAGRRVVRLKGGDPFVFGRGGEEAEALAEAGVDYEVVPGVTAALGAAAYAGLPLTHRRRSSAVAFVTGHEKPGKAESPLDWAALARFPGTLVVYMGMARLPQVVGQPAGQRHGAGHPHGGRAVGDDRPAAHRRGAAVRVGRGG